MATSHQYIFDSVDKTVVNLSRLTTTIPALVKLFIIPSNKIILLTFDQNFKHIISEIRNLNKTIDRSCKIRWLLVV